MEPELIARALPAAALEEYDQDSHVGRMELYLAISETLRGVANKAGGVTARHLLYAIDELSSAMNSESDALETYHRDLKAGVA